jgi:hypothetical protein
METCLYTGCGPSSGTATRCTKPLRNCIEKVSTNSPSISNSNLCKWYVVWMDESPGAMVPRRERSVAPT